MTRVPDAFFFLSEGGDHCPERWRGTGFIFTNKSHGDDLITRLLSGKTNNKGAHCGVNVMKSKSQIFTLDISLEV